jgi:hypothetical protein
VAGTIERLAGVLRSASGHTVATVEIELVMWSRAEHECGRRPVGRGRSASVRAGRKALFFTTGIAVVSYFATEMESYCETGGGVLVR